MSSNLKNIQIENRVNRPCRQYCRVVLGTNEKPKKRHRAEVIRKKKRAGEAGKKIAHAKSRSATSNTPVPIAIRNLTAPRCEPPDAPG